MRKKRYAFAICAMCMTLTNVSFAAPVTETQAMIESSIDESTSFEDQTSSVTETAETESEAGESGIDEQLETSDGITTLETMQETTETEKSGTETIAESEEESDNIIKADDSRLDDEGRISVKVTFTENAVFPYTITLKGTEGEVQFTIQKNGQELLIKPDTYTVKEVVNGKGKKLSKGAELTVTDRTETVYLDFTKPKTFTDVSFTSIGIVNIAFLVIAWIAYMLFRKFKESVND